MRSLDIYISETRRLIIEPDVLSLNDQWLEKASTSQKSSETGVEALLCNVTSTNMNYV